MAVPLESLTTAVSHAFGATPSSKASAQRSSSHSSANAVTQLAEQTSFQSRSSTWKLIALKCQTPHAFDLRRVECAPRPSWRRAQSVGRSAASACVSAGRIARS